MNVSLFGLTFRKVILPPVWTTWIVWGCVSSSLEPTAMPARASTAIIANPKLRSSLRRILSPLVSRTEMA